jgi:bacterioferritin
LLNLRRKRGFSLQFRRDDNQNNNGFNVKQHSIKNDSKLELMSSISSLRKDARKNIEEGAVTAGYGADRKEVVKLLNEALATELVCVLRYKLHSFMARGIHADAVKAEFQAHAIEEMTHADLLAKRITELGGEPDFSPEGLSERSHAEYIKGDTLEAMIKENLVAERIAIESYREIILYLADNDPTTQNLIKNILSTEEEHADELSSMLINMNH